MTRFLTLILAFLLPLCALADTARPLRPGWMFASPGAVAGDYTSFCLDREGFLWIGTDRGLLRFDGNNYDTYIPEHATERSLSDNRILALLCDSQGRVWVATANGLNLYDPTTDTFDLIKLPSKNFNGYIIAIAEQNDGTVTFIVSGVGVYVIGEEEGKPVAVRYLINGDIEKELNSLVCAPDGRIYAGTQDGTLCIIERNGKLNRVAVSSDYIKDLSIEADGNLLIADISNLYRLNIADQSVITLVSPRPLEITRMSSAYDGAVYAGTVGRGLWRVVCGADTPEPCIDIYSAFINLSTAFIGAVYCSPDGNLWLGCNYYGLVMVPGHQLPFLYRKFSDVFPDFGGGIQALSTWQGKVLAGLGKGRLALFSPSGDLLQSVTVPGGGSISSLTPEGDDRMLVGVANDGVWELHLPSGRLNRVVEIPGKYPSISVAPGLGEDLFIAVHGRGLLRYNRSTGSQEWIPYKSESDRLSNPYITTLRRTADDRIWIGLYGGLGCYDLQGDSLVAIQQDSFLQGASFDIAPVSDGSVLVATSHGLVHIDTRKGMIRKYTHEDGLLTNDVRSIAVDRNGGRWIGTLRGLSYQDPSTDVIQSYYGGYGLVENAFTHLAFSPVGNQIFLGSNLGVTSFSPDSVPVPDFDTDLKISGIYLNGNRITPSTLFGNHRVIEGAAIAPERLWLPYEDNALTLRLSTMDFRDGSNVRYAWRLAGFDDDWKSTRTGESLIYLPHLNPGKYTLELKAMENSVESQPVSIAINISTPWYITPWAKLIYLIIFATLLWLAWTLFKKKREEQENDARIKFFIDVSHDIRSPITLILSPLESLLKQPLDTDVRLKLQTMQRNAHRILSLVNQLLDIRKLEKGKMRLACQLTDLGSFVGELVGMFSSQAAEKHQKLEYVQNGEIPLVWVDRDNFDKILVNIISNAIKYTPKDGSITVALSLAEDDVLGECVQVSVTDTGIGLDSKTEAHLFERFYRAREGGSHGQSRSGFGIGLDLCRRLVELHHGTISGHNRSDGVRGSVFAIRLPIDESCYNDEELIYTDDSNQTKGHDAKVMQSSLQSVIKEPTERRPRQSSVMRRVLVVDDDAELREYLCRQLSQHYKVTGVSDGVEAMKAVGENMPEIIISDVMMPNMDGLTLLHRLKGNAATHHVPVILLSSKNDIADRMTGWDKGADGYLGKPFSTDELEALIDNLIDNRLRLKGKYTGAQSAGDTIEVPEVKSANELLMERVMKIITTYIDDPRLNVEKLSQEVGISRAHLHRKLKDMIGMTPSDFIRNIRLRRACELLQKSDIEVTQVAYTLGFTSQSHFSTAFKNFTGFSPTEYRSRCMAGNIPPLEPTGDSHSREDNSTASKP